MKNSNHHICFCGNQMVLVKKATKKWLALFGCHNCNVGIFFYDRDNAMLCRLSEHLAL